MHRQRRISVHPLIWVDHAMLRRIADRGTAEEMRGERDVEQLTPGATGHAVDLLGDPAGDLVSDRDPGRIGYAVALLAGHPPESQPGAFGERRNRVVQMLHHQRDHRALAPPPRIEQPNHATGILAGLIEELPPAWDVA